MAANFDTSLLMHPFLWIFMCDKCVIFFGGLIFLKLQKMVIMSICTSILWPGRMVYLSPVLYSFIAVVGWAQRRHSRNMYAGQMTVIFWSSNRRPFTLGPSNMTRSCLDFKPFGVNFARKLLCSSSCCIWLPVYRGIISELCNYQRDAQFFNEVHSLR